MAEGEWPLVCVEFEAYTLAPMLNAWFPTGSSRTVVEAVRVDHVEEVRQWRRSFEGYTWPPDTSFLSPSCPSQVKGLLPMCSQLPRLLVFPKHSWSGKLPAEPSETASNIGPSSSKLVLLKLGCRVGSERGKASRECVRKLLLCGKDKCKNAPVRL